MTKIICFFTTTFSFHEQMRMFYVEKYLPKNFKIFLITPKSQDKYSLKRTIIIKAPEEKINFLFFLRKFCITKKVDLLFNLGTIREAYGALFASIFLKTEFIITEGGNLIEFPKLNPNLVKKVINRIDQFFIFLILGLFSKKIIFQSKDQTALVKKILFFSKKKIHYLPLILDEKTFNLKDKYKIRKKLKLPLNKKIILFVGRISPLKGSDILKEIIKKNKEIYFILIGDILDEDILKLKFKNLKILSFKKPEELSDYYSAVDLLILPSKIEGFGLVPRESMLCGTPALVSDILALRVIPNAIVSKNDFASIQKQIEKIFSSPLTNKQKLKLRKAIIKETSYKNLKEKYLNIFYK